MYSVPIEVIENWPTPNYVNPETRNNYDLWIVTSIFLLISTGCVCARLWVRIFIRKWFGVDDFFIVLAFFCAIAVTALVAIQQTRYHWNRHLWDVPPSVFQDSTRLFYAVRLFWALAATFIRFSVLALYYRLLSAIPAPRHYLWILHLATAFNVALALVFVLAGTLSCLPIRAYWTFPPLDGARCIDDIAATEASGILNTIAEFIVALLPILAVIRMKIEKPWNVIGLLSLGMCVVVVGIFRTYFIFKCLNTDDFTWWSGPQWICAEVENSIGIICACAVPLRPVVGRIIKPTLADSGVVLSSRESKDSTAVEEDHMFNQIHARADIEEVEEWNHIVKNVVDLEGIANDGLGYAVTITGPNQPRRRVQGWLHGATTNLLDPRKKKDRPPPLTVLNLQIPLETEVTVEESYRSPSDGTFPGPRGSQRPSYDEKAMDQLYPNLFGDQAQLTPVPPVSIDAEEDAGESYPISSHDRG